MAISPDGLMRPRVLGPVSTPATERILQVCPGVSIDGTRTGHADRFVAHDAVFGPMTHISNGYATDESIRFIGSAGGTLTALGIFMLETGRVDGIAHVTASREAPMRTVAKISTTRDEVIRAAGSRYGPVAPLQRVLELLDGGTRFAVIGKPCDIAAMRNLAKFDSRVANQVPYMLSFLCGGVSSLGVSQRILARHGVTESELALFRYRGHGWPGMMTVETKDGRVFAQTYKETWEGPEGYSLQFRCKICADSVGLGADVVIADPWVPEAPREEFRDGWGGNFARTGKGAALLLDAEKAGVLYLKHYTLEELRVAARYQVNRRASLLARLTAMVLMGAPIPRYRKLAVWRSALKRGLVFHSRNLVGTLSRLRKGAGKETLLTPNAVYRGDARPTTTEWSASEGRGSDWG